MRAAPGRALVVALAAVLFSGCTAKVGGLPVAGTAVSEPPGRAEAVLGELTTIDPCALTDPAVFAEFGEVSFGVPESLDYCTILVAPDPSTQVLILVGELGWLADTPELAAARVEDVADGLYVAERARTPDLCARALVFAEAGLTIDVGTRHYVNSVPDTCGMVAAGMAKVVEVVLAGEVEHRRPAPDSLLTLDPCALVADETVTALPGFAAVTRRGGPGRHQCHWQTSDGADRLTVRVLFDARPPPEPFGSGSAALPVAGRASVTGRVPEAEANTRAYCWVQTGHIPFDEVAGHPDVVEVAGVYVTVPAGQLAAGCQAATTVATALWPKLPALR